MTRRVMTAAMTAAVTGAMGLLAGSMAVYPGGTQWDRTTHGNDFWRNYVCDLARTVALDGAPNPMGSALARGAMALLSLALLQMWWRLPVLFPARTVLAGCVRALGSLAVAGSLVVVALPADQFSDVHGAAIVAAGAPGLIAALVAVRGAALHEPTPRWVTLIGATALGASIIAFVIYLRQFFVPGPGPVAGAVFERLALIALVTWLFAVAWRTSRD
jgi:hypothetical protein